MSPDVVRVPVEIDQALEKAAARIGAKRPLTRYPILQVFMVPLAGTVCRQPIAAWAALQALLAGATLALKSDGKDRANGHARKR